MRTAPGAMAVWLAGVLAYIVAILHRTSLGVTGLTAVERFDTSASALSMFVVVQLVVYAGLQIPVGVMLDRYGSRRLLLSGAALMAVGQVVLALAASVPVAIVGRVLVGAGDAMTFVCVLRLVVVWFPPARAPLLMQLTGMLGQLGQVLSAYPLVALLGVAGWTRTFSSLAAISVLVVILVLAVVRDSPQQAAGEPEPEDAQQSRGAREVWNGLGTVARHPGTRLGLWSHFLTPFPMTVFALMWGYPFLVAGQGLSPVTASALLTVLSLASLVFGPLLGSATGRHPLRRSWLVLSVAGGAAVTWAVVLAWPGPAPLPLLVLLMVVLAAGGPASMIGFDYARTSNPPTSLGTANGVVNVGGFTSALLCIAAVGVALDVVSDGQELTLDDFRIAMSVQFVFMAIGVVGVVRSRRRGRTFLAEQGVVVPPLREAIARNRRARDTRRGEGPRSS